jgi:hypothetical protein
MVKSTLAGLFRFMLPSNPYGMSMRGRDVLGLQANAEAEKKQRGKRQQKRQRQTQ